MVRDKGDNLRHPNGLRAFGKSLRTLREGRGMTLDSLAQATGISKPYLSQIETARTPGPPRRGVEPRCRETGGRRQAATRQETHFFDFSHCVLAGNFLCSCSYDSV